MKKKPTKRNALRHGFCPKRLARLDDYLASLVAEKRVVGISNLILRNGEEVDYRAHGSRDAAGKSALARDTIFRIYSMTKPITAAAMFLLFEEGRWMLDDPVAKFLPEVEGMQVLAGLDSSGRELLEEQRAPMTLRHLLLHTSGLSYGLTLPDQLPSAIDRFYDGQSLFRQDQTLEEFGAKIFALPLAHQPGSAYRYSVATDMLGLVAQRISGMPYAQFLQERLFGPLGMRDTGFSVPASKLKRVADLFAHDASGQITSELKVQYRPDPAHPKPLPSGGAGLFSTIDDYARFVQMLANGGALDGVRIFAPATLRLLLAPSGGEMSPTYSVGMIRCLGGMDVAVAPEKYGGVVGVDTAFGGGAAGTSFWFDPTYGVVEVSMLQVTGWQGVGPAYALEPLVYQALVEIDG
jgi:CubicO group peptidase (beta-lactamase class C family)